MLDALEDAPRWSQQLLMLVKVCDTAPGNPPIGKIPLIFKTATQPGSVMLWKQSTLFEACKQGEGACRRFVAHPHCQQLLEENYAGATLARRATSRCTSATLGASACSCSRLASSACRGVGATMMEASTMELATLLR